MQERRKRPSSPEHLQRDDADQTIASDPDATQPLTPAPSGDAIRRGASVHLEPGLVLGDYRLEKRLGEGGFAEVWLVERLTDGHRLALKMLRLTRQASTDAASRFEREGRLAASLNHPRVVGVVGAETIEGQLCMLMEVMPGGTMNDRLQAEGPVAWREAVDLILDVLEGLEAAHRHGIVHRDIKPSNCFVDHDGRLEIGDFGLSRTLEATTDLTMTGTVLGTPAYASPEQIRGLEVDFRADIYSAGATLYAFLTGSPPHEGVAVGDLIAKITSGAPCKSMEEHGVTVPRDLQKVMERMLAGDPDERYQDYLSLREALLRFSSHGRRPARPIVRLAAGVFDALLFGLIGAAMSMADDRTWAAAGELTAPPWLLVAISVVFFIAYVVMEKRWSTTPGKYLLRMRVVTTEGNQISWRQSVIRSGLFSLSSIPEIALAFTRIESGPLQQVISLAVLAALFVTMRRRNGYAAIHGVLSGTRVVRVSSLQPRIAVADAPVIETGPAPLPADVPDRVGPYEVRRILWMTTTAGLLAAWDRALDRDVWIHLRRTTDAQEDGRRGEIRATRLSWLMSGRLDDTTWDAFDAPSGAGWRNSRCRDAGWREFGALLADLLGEIRLGEERGDRPRNLSTDQLWVDGYGQLKLLEFPADSPEGVDRPSRFFESAEWPGFVRDLIRDWLEQRDRTGAAAENPLSAQQQELLDSLLSETIATPEISGILDRLGEHHREYGPLTRRKRLLHLAATFGLVSALFSGLPFVAVLNGSGAGVRAIVLAMHAGMLGYAFVAVPALVMTALAGTGPMMRGFGIAIVTRSGARAGRLRCLARALLVWLPALIHVIPLIIAFSGSGWAAATAADPGTPTVSLAGHWYGHFLQGWATTLALATMMVSSLVFHAGIVRALWCPSRGWHDMLAGTRLVGK